MKVMKSQVTIFKDGNVVYETHDATVVEYGLYGRDDYKMSITFPENHRPLQSGEMMEVITTVEYDQEEIAMQQEKDLQELLRRRSLLERNLL